MSTVILILSIISFLHELSGITKKRFSFIIRYILVVYLFRDLEVFKNELLNFVFFEMISIGMIIYILSYLTVGILMKFFDIYSSGLWKFIYFVVYVVYTFVLFFICLGLNSIGKLPVI